MTSQNILVLIWAYIRQHWFKFSLLVLFLIACFKKDLSFSLRLNSDKDIKKVELKKESPNTKVTVADNVKTEESTPLSILGNLLSSGDTDEVLPEVNDAEKWRYMKRFVQVAVGERKKYGIPSSIIVANALRQSFAGKRAMTLKSNNHFALPCTFDWNGTGDNYGKTCYRRYENAWVSFRDHSVFITSGKFSELRTLNSADYKGWANGLERLGYPSGTAHLAGDLVKIIEAYGLDKLDKM